MSTETVRQVSYEGGCPTCDAGLVVHTVTGVAYLVDLHLDGRHEEVPC